MTNLILGGIGCRDDGEEESRCLSRFCLKNCSDIYEFMRKELVCG